MEPFHTPSLMDADRTIIEAMKTLAAQSGLAVREISLVPGGFENWTVRTELDTGRLVILRLSRRRTVEEVTAELAFINIAHTTGVNVARPLSLFGYAALSDTPLGVLVAFEYLQGITKRQLIDNYLAPLVAQVRKLAQSGSMTADEKRRSSRPFMARVHSDIDHYGVSMYGRTDTMLLHRLAQQLYTDSRKDHLVHGDIHPGNIIWTSSPEEVKPYIIDFDDCYRGCIDDEYYAFLRGWSFEGDNLQMDRLYQLARMLEISGSMEDILYRLAGECLYFFSALCDSAERAGVIPSAEHIVDYGRAISCLEEARRL